LILQKRNAFFYLILGNENFKKKFLYFYSIFVEQKLIFNKNNPLPLFVLKDYLMTDKIFYCVYVY